MKRTQIYISEQQDGRLTERARAERISKAEVIRRILDRALDTGDAEAEARAIIQSTAGICRDYPDWPEWQRSVRGRPAAERLRASGL
jgi:Ribbon-helix-helix protein, copG family